MSFETTKTAPIALFAYARPGHTRRTVESLARNDLAGESDLIIYADAARDATKQAAVEEVRSYLKGVSGFRSVAVRHRAENLGLARSIIGGVTEVLQGASRLVVVEDDMVTSPHFLTYVNQALNRYDEDPRVVSVHGYVYPVGRPLPETFFIRGADCWGWATWARAWKLFNPDGRSLLDELGRRGLTRSFDYDDTYPYSKMLQGQVEGRNDSWAVRWHASAFLADKLTLYPGRSLVQNIGQDGSGTHGSNEGGTEGWSASLSQTPVEVRDIPREPSREGREAFIEYFRRSRPRPPRSLRDFVPDSIRSWARGLRRGGTQ